MASALTSPNALAEDHRPSCGATGVFCRRGRLRRLVQPPRLHLLIEQLGRPCPSVASLGLSA